VPITWAWTLPGIVAIVPRRFVASFPHSCSSGGTGAAGAACCTDVSDPPEPIELTATPTPIASAATRPSTMTAVR
jgi:hypothetical protein